MSQLLVLWRIWWVWRRFPELRLGQLLHASFPHPVEGGPRDLFYIRDRELTERLVKFGERRPVGRISGSQPGDTGSRPVARSSYRV